MDQLGCGSTLEASPEATGTDEGSIHKVPGPVLYLCASADASVSTTEGESPVGSVLWDGMKQIAQCVSALASVRLDDCMKYIIKHLRFDLSQPCGRRLFVDSTFYALEGMRWYVRVVVRGTIGCFLVDSGLRSRVLDGNFSIV